MLAANPLLTIPSGQFFEQNVATANTVPLRASFTDVIDDPAVEANFTSSIDWGDGSPLDTSQAVFITR